MPKILHICVYTWEHGGPPKVVYDMAKAEKQAGFDVQILNTQSAGEKLYLPIEGVEIKTITLGVLHKFIPFSSIELLQFLSQNASDYKIIHLHGLWNFHGLACHVLGLHKKCFLTVHGMLHPFTLNMGRLKKRLFSVLFQKNFLRKINTLHVLHKGELQDLENYIGESPNVFLCPNGIELSPFVEQNRNKTILFLGRLHFKKGVILLLKAFEMLRKRQPTVNLIFAGPDYGSGSEIKRIIAENKIGGVSLIGPVHGQEKQNLMEKSGVFCLPSYSEGFSIAVLEALSQGIPVVVSPETGLSEDIKEYEAGWVCDFSENELAQKLESALFNFSQAHDKSKNGFALVKDRFETQVVNQKIIEKVKQILKSH